jgi:hypothetical protein
MPEFEVGDFVKHMQSDVHVFEIVDELTSSPPGRSSLFECVLVSPPLDQLGDEDAAKVKTEVHTCIAKTICTK